MSRLLNVVDAFRIPGRGIVIVARTEMREVGLISGDTFELVLSAGQLRTLKALGVERFTKCFTEATTVGILVGDQLDTLDGVAGSELRISAGS